MNAISGGDFRQLTAMAAPGAHPAYRPRFQAPCSGEMPVANGSGADHASSGGKLPMASGMTRGAYRMHPYVVGPPPPQHNPPV